MRIRALICAAPALVACVALLSAGDPLTTPHSRNVGTIYGKVVTEDDIGLKGPIAPSVRFDSRDETRWKLRERIVTTFGGPVVDRFVKQHKIEATIDEVQLFTNNSRKRSERNIHKWETRLAELKREIAVPNLSDLDKAKLQNEEEMYEQFVAANRDSLAADKFESRARTFIVAWKVERDLHRHYGGRVIHQQAGLEALDARRVLFEEAEKNGDITFDDPGVRHLFYYYANMKHVVASDKAALENPWFLERDD